MAVNLPSFPIFDITDLTSVSTNWSKYKRRFETLCKALKVTDDKQKVAMLLNYVGDDVYDIYENIMKPEAEDSYEDVTKALEKHFAPTINQSYETYLFRSMKQKAEETMQQFYIRLKEQSTKCNFTDDSKEIKQQIELNTINNKLRQFSFRNPGKSLPELLAEARTIEDTKLQADELEKVAETAQESINTARTGKQRTNPGKKLFHEGRKMSSTQKCFRCGGNYPHERTCPATGKTCFTCGNLGHFEKFCRTKHRQISQKFEKENQVARHRPPSPPPALPQALY